MRGRKVNVEKEVVLERNILWMQNGRGKNIWNRELIREREGSGGNKDEGWKRSKSWCRKD